MFTFLSFSAENAATFLAAAAFIVGAFVNASGHKAIREEFVRYGFPSWWCWVTALMEFITAVLLVLRPGFAIGVALGACIMIAAIVAVLRARDFRHIPPPAVFLALLAIAACVRFYS